MTSPSNRPMPRREPAPPPHEVRAAARPEAAARDAAAPRARRVPRLRPESRTEPRLDGSSWAGAIIAMSAVGALLWAVQIANALDHYSVNRFALRPREVRGLWGILTQPFLHASYRDMISDTLPVVLIGWVLLLAGLRTWASVTAVVVLVGGALTWLIGPGDALVLGDSSLVFGWIGYLVARAVFARRIKWILVAIMVLLIFGTLLAGLVPVSHSQESWQAHLAGFVAGVGVAALLHPRRGGRRSARRSSVS